ncbi:MAG: hypothetical protein R3B70_30675 [Polyangiaceae bacterium]
MSVDHLPPPREVDRELLSSTIAATIEASFAQCAPDGRFVSPAHLGIAPTLQTMAMHHFLGTLDPEIAKRAATLVMKTQLPHGAFPNFLGDPAGDPWITGLAIAGLRLAGDPSFEEPIARARAYMARAGGDALAANGIYRCNLLSLYIAMAGELDPSALPELPVEGMFVHPVLDAMRTKACVQILWMGVAVWAIVRHLREPEKRGSPSWLESIERKRAPGDHRPVSEPAFRQLQRQCLPDYPGCRGFPRARRPRGRPAHHGRPDVDSQHSTTARRP